MFDYNSMHASISTLRQKQIFFVGGSPKSGTTWLQLLLDAHPSVSCSGEGYFPTHLWRFLKQALNQYDRTIETNNKVLFNELEAYRRLTQDDVRYIFATCIAVVLLKQAKHKLARAIGDKTPANSGNFSKLATLFPTEIHPNCPRRPRLRGFWLVPQPAESRLGALESWLVR